MAFTTDVTSWLAVGHDLNTLERESELQSHIERVFPMIGRRVAAPFPYWRHVKLPADRAAERSLCAGATGGRRVHRGSANAHG
jgi:hypothetical protein